ncbi:MAG: branched-chain amino acid ABC transporter permease, partial [Hyphomicrobiales bacterium]|nr:branched-chain amino acid ABC transporter permease [Hyphomicrobiales bacterium]
MSAIDTGAALPQQKTDYIPVLLPIALALLAFPLVGSFSTWTTLTLAGLAMGMMIFAMASGLTLVFGLMDVMNFGHGAFVAVGAYVAVVAFAPM